MPDQVPVLNVVVPATFYRALNLYLAEVPEDTALITEELRITLDAFLKVVVDECIHDSALRRRTGRTFDQLRNGILTIGAGTPNTIRGYVMGDPYVAALERGAEIHPKRGLKLAVPLPPALYSDGTPRRPTPAAWRPMGTFTYVSRRTGRSYLAYKGPGGELIILYVFVDMVTLSPMLGLSRAYNKLFPLLLQSWSAVLVGEISKWGDADAIAGLRNVLPKVARRI